jgi:hypothetical protein
MSVVYRLATEAERERERERARAYWKTKKQTGSLTRSLTYTMKGKEMNVPKVN